MDATGHTDALEWEVLGYGAEREQDDEDNGHDAGVRIAFAVEDLVAVLEICSFVERMVRLRLGLEGRCYSQGCAVLSVCAS